MDGGTHTCPAPRCLKGISTDYAFCGEHWAKLSWPTAQAIKAAYRPGQGVADWTEDYRNAFNCALIELGGSPLPKANDPGLFGKDAPVRFSQERLKRSLEREIRWRAQVFPKPDGERVCRACHALRACNARLQAHA